MGCETLFCLSKCPSKRSKVPLTRNGDIYDKCKLGLIFFQGFVRTGKKSNRIESKGELPTISGHFFLSLRVPVNRQHSFAFDQGESYGLAFRWRYRINNLLRTV